MLIEEARQVVISNMQALVIIKVELGLDLLSLSNNFQTQFNYRIYLEYLVSLEVEKSPLTNWGGGVNPNNDA